MKRYFSTRENTFFIIVICSRLVDHDKARLFRLQFAYISLKIISTSLIILFRTVRWLKDWQQPILDRRAEQDAKISC